MKQKIKLHLLRNNSYFKWSAKRLANMYGCSERTVVSVIKSLQPIKNLYLSNLK